MREKDRGQSGYETGQGTRGIDRNSVRDGAYPAGRTYGPPRDDPRHISPQTAPRRSFLALIAAALFTGLFVEFVSSIWVHSFPVRLGICAVAVAIVFALQVLWRQLLQ